jgi:hypothetical protein
MLTAPKSIPPRLIGNSCWRTLLVVSFSLDLPSPTVQPDGQADSTLPLAGELATGEWLPTSLGRSSVNANRTAPPLINQTERLAHPAGSPTAGRCR